MPIPTPSVSRRRSVRRSRLPLLALPLLPATDDGAADPDAPLIEAWERRCALRHIMDGDDISDAVRTTLVAPWDDLGRRIASAPGRGRGAVEIKLRLLLEVAQDGGAAEWEAEAIRTALAALERTF